MTLSDETRLQAVNAALSGMLFELGDRMFLSVRFELRSDRFRDLPQTTWLELESGGYVERMHAMDNPGFKLTGQGWVAALNAAGLYDTPEVRERAIALRAALKGAVKGRPLHGAITDLSSLHSETGVPANWIANALCSRLAAALVA